MHLLLPVAELKGAAITSVDYRSFIILHTVLLQGILEFTELCLIVTASRETSKWAYDSLDSSFGLVEINFRVGRDGKIIDGLKPARAGRTSGTGHKRWYTSKTWNNSQ